MKSMSGSPDVLTAHIGCPVVTSHSEAVHAELEGSMTPDEARELFAGVPGVIVRDDPANDVYPLPTDGAGVDEVFVGRIRADDSLPEGKGLAFWVVSDNLRKGAATNAVEIAEIVERNGWLAKASERVAGTA